VRFLLPLLTLLFAVVAAQAQPQRPPPALPPNNHETQLFRGLLNFHKIQPETVENIGARYDYSSLIVVVYGDPNNQRVVNICRAALANGGAVLIASDTDMALSAYFPSGGDVRITNSRVTFNKAEAVDRGVGNRPLAFPMPPNGTSPFNGIERVATLDSAYLLNTRPPAGVPLVPVAAFLPGANVTTSTGRPIGGLGALPLAFALATTDDRLPVRCMVLADPDVFSNRLIYTSGREDDPTDNLKLANNTVQWLKGRGRTRCLFVENGNPVTKFDEFEFSSIPVGPPIPPVPPIPVPDVFDPELQRTIADAGNKAIDEAERKDAMNRGILSAFYGRKSTVIAVLACILLALTYLIVRRRAVADWYRKVFRPIPRDPAMLGPDVPVGSIEHRRLELLRSADYGPVLRPVVRQLFQDRGLPGEYAGDKLPPLDIAVGRPQYLREAIHSLWAVVRTSAPVGYGRWKQLEPLLAAVRAAADDDRWRFVAPSPRDAAS
jgi:hypothetical protein